MQVRSRSLRQTLTFFVVVLTAVVSAVVAGTSIGRAADDGAGIVIIMDGSGSMWGKLGQGPQSKLVAAREALAQALPAQLETATGLVTFGRRRGDCSDVELVAAPETGDRGRILGQIERLNPRGKGPITLALRQAAKALEGLNGPHHVVMIHDDADNCVADTCPAATELKAADPRLVVTTVSLGTSAEDVKAVACLAQTTGGKALTADTPQEAMTAIATALRFATLDRSVPVPQAAQRPAVASSPEKSGPPRVKVSARLGSADGPLVTSGVAWRIWPATGTDATIAETAAPMAEISLDPGRYRVEVRAGLLSAAREIDVATTGATVVEIPLAAGSLKLNGTLKRAGPASPTARMSVRADGDAVRQALWIGAGGELVVPPGTYRVVAQEGRAAAERTIVVAAGQSVNADVALEAGRITLSATGRDGGTPLDDVLYRVLEPDPDAPDGQREVIRTAAATVDLVLPAGTYQIVARQGAAEARERIVVNAGDEVRHVFRLPVAKLALSVRSSAGKPVDPMRWRVTPADGSEPVDGSADDATLTLPAGRAKIEVFWGAAPAPVTRDVDLKAGTEQKVALALPVAEVELKASDSAGAVLAEPYWEVVDPQGRTVWRSVQARPRSLLAEGRYTARLSSKTRRLEKAFDVKPGNAMVVTLGEE